MDSIGGTPVYIITEENLKGLMDRTNGKMPWESLFRISLHIWKNSTREAIQNQDLQQTGRCLNKIYHRERMIEFTVFSSAQAPRVTCSIRVEHRMVSYTQF